MEDGDALVQASRREPGRGDLASVPAAPLAQHLRCRGHGDRAAHRRGRDDSSAILAGRGAIYVVSRRGRTWWRNLESNPEVWVQLRGQRVAGEATIVDLPVARMDGALESGALASAARRSDAVIVRIRVGAAR